MTTVGVLLGTLLLIFQIVLIARLVVDWVGVLAGGPEPGWRRGARRVTHTVTEPVLAPVRRVLRPVRIGSVGLDQVFAPEMFSGGDAHADVSGVEKLLDRLEDDEFDLVAVGRALLADPEWGRKVLDGRESELVPFTKAALGTLH